MTDTTVGPVNPLPASADRLCPRDDADLVARSHLGVDFLGCGRCGGLWFPRHGLERLELRAPKGSRPPRASSAVADRRAKSGVVACVCTGRPAMEPVERFGVTVDLCRACGAVWLDAGEIERILQCYREPGSEPGEARAGREPPLMRGAAAVGDLAWSTGVVGTVLDFLLGSGGVADL